MDEIRLEHQRNGEKITVVVRAANGLRGVRRHRLRYEQSLIDEPDHDLRLMRLLHYPDMTAAADVCINDQPVHLTFEEFIALPDELFERWDEATADLNPHWYEKREKKVTT